MWMINHSSELAGKCACSMLSVGGGGDMMWRVRCHAILVQGEDQKKLDVISNDVFKNCLASTGRTVRVLSRL